MERVQFITYKGVNILKVDLSHSKTVEENVAALDKAKATIGTRPPKSVLILTDVTKAYFNPRGVEEMKRFSTFNTPYVKASAVLGVVGIYRFIYEVIVKLTGRDIVCFDTEEEALDWLVAQ